jgi:MFS family permease
MLFVSRILGGMASGGVFPVSLSLVSDLVGPDKRQVAIGRTLAGSMAGNLLGATLSGLIGDFLGWRGVLALLGVLVIGSSIAVAAGFRGAALARPPRAKFAVIKQGYRTIFPTRTRNSATRPSSSKAAACSACFHRLVPVRTGRDPASIAGIVIAGLPSAACSTP